MFNSMDFLWIFLCDFCFGWNQSNERIIKWFCKPEEREREKEKESKNVI